MSKKKESLVHPSKQNDAVKKEGRPSPQSRREALQLLGAGVTLLVGCGSDPGTGAGGSAGSGGNGGATGGSGGATGGAGGSTGGAAGTGGAGGATGGAAGTGGATGGAGGATGGAAGTGGATGGAAGTAGKGGAAGAGGATGGAAGTGGATGGTAGAGGATGGAGGSAPDAGTGTDSGSGGAGGTSSDAGGGSDASVVCPSKDTPHVNVGPYYYDSMMNRSDIIDGKTGVPITYRFTILDANCKPIEGAVVDVWQADKEGIYSAYASQGTAGQLFLRGFQMTDAHGEATFKSIYPGWYSGRLTHLHGKIFLNGVQKDTTNFFFPKDIETAVYNSPLYSARGQNSVTVAQDVELKGDTASYNALMMTVTGDVTNGYVATYVIKYS